MHDYGLVKGIFQDVDLKTGLSSGVIIDDRHALVAYHAVKCPSIPIVHVVLPDNRRFRVVVSEEDPAHDMARVEIASAERFKTGVAPPTIAAPVVGEPVCTATAWPHGLKWHCGEVLAVGIKVCPGGDCLNGAFHHGAFSVKGNSGSGVYDVKGNLVGLVGGLWDKDVPEEGGYAMPIVKARGILK